MLTVQVCLLVALLAGVGKCFSMMCGVQHLPLPFSQSRLALPECASIHSMIRGQLHARTDVAESVIFEAYFTLL